MTLRLCRPVVGGCGVIQSAHHGADGSAFVHRDQGWLRFGRGAIPHSVLREVLKATVEGRSHVDLSDEIGLDFLYLGSDPVDEMAAARPVGDVFL